MSRIRIFVSYDDRHDADLNDLLCAQARHAEANFEVVGADRFDAPSDPWSADPRSLISDADVVVVICGEQTHEAEQVALELEVAREEETPYLLLWGRREQMCTKPANALSSDGMYSWTREVLEGQMEMAVERARPLVIPDSCKRKDR